MSDTSGAVAAMQAADPSVGQQAPAEQQTTVDTTTAAPAAEQQAAEDFSVMPLWKDKLEQLPEAMRADYAALIADTEKNANKAIQKARESSVPSEFRGLYDEMQEAGLSPDQMRDAYNNSLNLQQALLEDPYGTLRQLESQIDEAVRAGDITLAEGKAAMRDIAAAVDDQVNQAPLETEADREIAELKAWRSQQEARAAQQEEERQREDYARDAQQFITDAESAFASNGLVNDKGEHITSVETRRSVFILAGQAKDANPSLTAQQAVQQAVDTLGGWDRFRPTNTPGIPVSGGNGIPPMPNDADRALPDKERVQNAAALIRNLTQRT